MYDLYDNITARLRSSGDYLWPLERSRAVILS